MLAWSNGTGYYDGNLINQFSTKIEESLPLPFKQKPKKVYIKNDCVISLMPNGIVYKKGLMIFEQEEMSQESIVEIQFPQFDSIQKIKFGDSHVLFLGNKGDIYSWGNNYFGQLGINNMMIAVRNDPQQIKLFSGPLVCNKIHAYRNNSFAIDRSGTLYIWGKSDYLMGVYKSNLFRPTPFLSDFKIKTIKHSGGRMIIYAQKEDENHQKDIDNSIDEGIYNNMNDTSSLHANAEKEAKKESAVITMVKSTKAKIEVNSLSAIPMFANLNSHINNIVNPKEAVAQKKLVLTSQGLNSIILGLYDYILKLNEDNQLLARLRQFCLEPKKHQLLENINEIWEKTTEVIKQAKQEKGDQLVQTFVKQVKIPNRYRLDTFCSFFSIKLCYYYDKMQFNQFNKNLFLLPSQLRNCESVLKPLVHTAEEDNEKEILTNFSNVLYYSIKYKTLENFIHRLSMHQYLFQQYDFNKIIVRFEDIIAKQYEAETKLYLVEKLYDNLQFIIAKYELTIQSLEEYIGSLDSDSEKFIYQALIDTNNYLKNLWKYYTYHSKEDYLLKIKEQQLEFIDGVFDEIHVIQKRGIDLLQFATNIHNSIDHFIHNNSNVKESNQLFNQLLKQCTDDEIVKELDLMDELLDDINVLLKLEVNKNYEPMTKEIIINFATSVYQTIKLKKILLSMTSNITKFDTSFDDESDQQIE